MSIKARFARTSALLVLLGACAKTPEPLPEPAPASEPPPTPAPAPEVDQDELIEVRRDRFCAELARIVDAEDEAFIGLRVGEIDDYTWQASVIPNGLIECEIEGRKRPVAVYSCRSQPLAGAATGVLEPVFQQTAADLDHCFSRPVWFPRDWERGRVIEFARGEKQLVWRDVTTRPRPSVSLKIEEDFMTRVHYLHLAVGTEI